jgi:hypothetical protein
LLTIFKIFFFLVKALEETAESTQMLMPPYAVHQHLQQTRGCDVVQQIVQQQPQGNVIVVYVPASSSSSQQCANAGHLLVFLNFSHIIYPLS